MAQVEKLPKKEKPPKLKDRNKWDKKNLPPGPDYPIPNK